MDDELILGVQNRHNAVQIRDQHAVAANLHVAGLTHCIVHKSQVRSVQRKVLNSSIASVGHHQRGLACEIGAAQVNIDAVRARHLARVLTGTGNDLLPLAVLGERVDETASVAVANKYCSIRTERRIGWAPLVSGCVHAAFHGAAGFPEHFAVQVCLYHHASTCIAVVQELRAVLGMQVKTVRATCKFLSKASDELAVG